MYLVAVSCCPFCLCSIWGTVDDPVGVRRWCGVSSAFRGWQVYITGELQAGKQQHLQSVKGAQIQLHTSAVSKHTVTTAETVAWTQESDNVAVRPAVWTWSDGTCCLEAAVNTMRPHAPIGCQCQSSHSPVHLRPPLMCHKTQHCLCSGTQ